jgi:hypothetical protein
MRPISIWRLLATLSLVLLRSASAAADDTLITISPDGWLVSFNPRTGAITEFHNRLPPDFVVRGTAWHDVDKKIYIAVQPTINGRFAPTTPPFSVLYTLDPETLELTKAADITGISQEVSGIAVNPASHTMVAAVTSGVGAASLYTIDPRSGLATLLTDLPIRSDNSIRGLSFDADGRFLYGLYYAISWNLAAPQSTNLFRIDLTNAQPPLLQSLDPAMGALTGLVLIPGTTSFYTSSGFRFPTPLPAPIPPTEGTFNLLDTTSLTLTKLGSDYWGEAPVAPLLYRNFNLAPEKPPADTTVSYTVRDLCFPDTCNATALNDKGEVAGLGINGDSTPFAVYSGTGLTRLQLPPGAVPTHMNSSGVIVGAWSVPAGYPAPPGAVYRHAFAYVPQPPQVYELNSAFGQVSAVATYINNRGDIAGGPIPRQTIFGLDFVSDIYGITDSGVLIAGQTLDTPTVRVDRIVIARPGLPPLYLPNYWRVPSFNNSGQVVGINFADDYAPFLYTPDVGPVPLPDDVVARRLSERPIAINDSGLILFSTSGASALIYDSSGRTSGITQLPVPLHAFVPPESGWTNLVPVALNNAGQILVQGLNTASGRKTALLFSPSGFAPGQR